MSRLPKSGDGVQRTPKRPSRLLGGAQTPRSLAPGCYAEALRGAALDRSAGTGSGARWSPGPSQWAAVEVQWKCSGSAVGVQRPLRPISVDPTAGGKVWDISLLLLPFASDFSLLRHHQLTHPPKTTKSHFSRSPRSENTPYRNFVESQCLRPPLNCKRPLRAMPPPWSWPAVQQFSELPPFNPNLDPVSHRLSRS